MFDFLYREELEGASSIMRLVARTARQDNALYGADALSAVQVGCRALCKALNVLDAEQYVCDRSISGLTSQTPSSAVQAWKPFAASLTNSSPCEPILLATSYRLPICKFGDSCKVDKPVHALGLC